MIEGRLPEALPACPQRSQRIAEIGGPWAYVNDSKATNVDAPAKGAVRLRTASAGICGGPWGEGGAGWTGLAAAGRIGGQGPMLIGREAASFRHEAQGGRGRDPAPTWANGPWPRRRGPRPSPADTVLLAPGGGPVRPNDNFEKRGEDFRCPGGETAVVSGAKPLYWCAVKAIRLEVAAARPGVPEIGQTARRGILRIRPDRGPPAATGRSPSIRSPAPWSGPVPARWAGPGC